MVAVDRAGSANESDIWLVSLDRGVATRFTYGPRLNSSALWSPDGSRIVFESNRDGLYDIFVKPTSGALPETPLVKGGSQFKHPNSWSPDGHLLAFYQMDARTSRGRRGRGAGTAGSGERHQGRLLVLDGVGDLLHPGQEWRTALEAGLPPLDAQAPRAAMLRILPE